ncbi:MAG: hypothetical protein A4E41_00117 [Methanoregulaceae archaeon PtaU1.Bin066]|nr:MAG: hypothetical protein A4E41_00117 [Methanoregulaceae archaeon PtaU1.Bin066]
MHEQSTLAAVRHIAGEFSECNSPIIPFSCAHFPECRQHIGDRAIHHAGSSGHISTDPGCIAVNREHPSFHLDPGEIPDVSMDNNCATGEGLCSKITCISQDFYSPSPHPPFFAAIAGTAVVPGVSMAGDCPSSHLAAKPGIGISPYLDGSSAHEVPAVHPDISLDPDNARFHIFANPFNFP